MKVSELIALSGAKALTGEFEDREIACGYTCDLLSHVMGKGQADMAWITLQDTARLNEMKEELTKEDDDGYAGI